MYATFGKHRINMMRKKLTLSMEYSKPLGYVDDDPDRVLELKYDSLSTINTQINIQKISRVFIEYTDPGIIMTVKYTRTGGGGTNRRRINIWCPISSVFLF